MEDLFKGYFFCDFDIHKGPIVRHHNIAVRSRVIN